MYHMNYEPMATSSMNNRETVEIKRGKSFIFSRDKIIRHNCVLQGGYYREEDVTYIDKRTEDII